LQITRNDLRNVAIIAHVDHGKTTLVDQMLRQSGVFRQNEAVRDRVMDSGDLERERGITILSKNTAVNYNGVKINIVDTPGHADFGGEVERVLKMVNGVILLVDSFEGPMPQTRFVLQKALALGHKVIIVVNKMDRPDARCDEVTDETLELLLDLGADDEQLDSPFLYCSGRTGTASVSPDQPGENLKPLFDAILEHIPAPTGDPDLPLQAPVSTIDYSDYVGRIGIARIERGHIERGMTVARVNYGEDTALPSERVVSLYQFDGLGRVETESAEVGDIVAIAGLADVQIGQTICPPDAPEALPFVPISPPTVQVMFMVNDSPFAGREGKYCTSRHLRARLERETMTDVSLHVEEGETPDSFKVSGRGELHLSILMEKMRRQGYEFQVSRPEAVMKTIDGVLCEPIEKVVIDAPSTCSGAVIEKLGRRGGILTMMSGDDRVRMEFLAPARGLFGYRSELMTDTRGEGIMSSVFEKYEPHRGPLPGRTTASLVAWEAGEAVLYGLCAVQDRGELFTPPGTQVYAGMIVGICSRSEDIDVNVCKQKHLTNMRAAGSDEALRLRLHPQLTLEEAIEFINDDERVEITPKSIRLRKAVLDARERLRIRAKAKK